MAAPSWDSLSTAAPEALPSPSPAEKPFDRNATPNWDDLQSPDESFGSPSQQAITALEQGASGASLGLSKVAETKFLGVKPEDIQSRESANPGTSFAFNTLGTAGLLAATDGLGLAALPEAGLLTKIGAAGLQGAEIGALNSVSNDAAFGDPNLAASKIAAHAGLSAFYGGLTAGVGGAILESAGPGLKSLAGKGKALGSPDLTISPESLGPLDQIRMGLASGLQAPEVQEQLVNKVASGLDSLNKLTSIENLKMVSGDSAVPEINHFLDAQSDFLKQFGDKKTGQINPDEVMDFITHPESKASKQQTIAFNNFFKATKGVSGIDLADENLNGAIKAAQSSLEDWTGALGDYSQSGPLLDMEYGGPKHGEFQPPKPYSSAFDLPPGESPAPNSSPGVTIASGPSGMGEATSRVPSLGTERTSPYQYEGPSFGQISSKVADYRAQLSNLLEKQSEGLPFSASDIKDSLEQGQGLGNQVQNLSKAKAAITAPGHEINPLLALGLTHIPIVGKPVLGLYALIRKFGGDGGLYRLGNTLASPIKVLDGIANVTEQIDKRIGDKARLIFTGTSSQARKIRDAQ